MKDNELLVSITRVRAATSMLRSFKLYYDNGEFICKIKNGEAKSFIIPKTAKHIYLTQNWGKSKKYIIRHNKVSITSGLLKLWITPEDVLNPLRALGIMSLPFKIDDIYPY